MAIEVLIFVAEELICVEKVDTNHHMREEVEQLQELKAPQAPVSVHPGLFLL